MLTLMDISWPHYYQICVQEKKMALGTSWWYHFNKLIMSRIFQLQVMNKWYETSINACICFMTET